MKPLLTRCLQSVLDGEHKPFTGDGRIKPWGGYATLSRYLWRHPLISATDLKVLGYIYDLVPYDAPHPEDVSLSKATLQSLRMDLHISRSTVTRTINYLVDLGLIIRDSQNGQKDVKLWTVPGPWPMLGDTPEHQWGVFTNEPAKVAKRWLELALEHGPTTDTLNLLLKEVPMLDSPKRAQVERDSLLDTPRKNASPHSGVGHLRQNAANSPLDLRQNEANVGQNIPQPRPGLLQNDANKVVDLLQNDAPEPVDNSVDNFSSSTGETPSPTQKTCLPASGARAPYIYKYKLEITKNLNQTIASLSAGDTEQAGATPGKPTGCVSKKIKGSVYPIPVVSENIGAARRDSSRKIRHDTIAKAALSTPPPKTRRRPNTTKQFEYKYRAKVEEMTDIVLPDFLVSERSQVKQSIKRYGAETMLKALDWVFDNWTTLQSRNHKLYSADKFPPLKSLTAARLLNPILPYVQKGEPMPEEVPYTLRPENKNYWAQSVSKLNAEREAAGGGVDVLVEWAKQRERGDV